MTPSHSANDVAHGCDPRMSPTRNASPDRTTSVTRRLRGEFVNHGWMSPRRAASSNPGHGELTYSSCQDVTKCRCRNPKVSAPSTTATIRGGKSLLRAIVSSAPSGRGAAGVFAS